MPLQETSGAASYDAFGGGAPAAPIYIEDVFSTWLYQGNGSGQTITNGIDLAGDGGMVWAKARNEAYSHELFDTARGSLSALISNTADSQNSYGPYDFLSSGFRYRAGYIGNANYSNTSYVSWTFRKQPKFFDVVLYTGDGTNNRAIPHRLNSVPGCIIVKATSASLGWGVKHRSLTASQYLVLNDTAAASTALNPWSQNPTSSEFYVNGTAPSLSNGNGIQYVAYLFAHNAGGFGLTGTDNVISCGSYTGNGTSGQLITLGYEPQFVLHRWYDGVEDWKINDVMRGMPVGGADATLYPNNADAEVSGVERLDPASTGFIATTNQNVNGRTDLYIAIRRGPMKVPTTGTSVFSPNATTAASGTKITTNFPVDVQFYADRAGAVYNTLASTRLMGVATGDLTSGQNGPYLVTSSTAAEATFYQSTRAWDNTGFGVTGSFGSASNIYWNWQRAPGFFDVVCYTGTGSARTVAHNLGVAPELMIVKRRGSSSFGEWLVWTSAFDPNYYVLLNGTQAINAGPSSAIWNGTAPTASVFSVGVYLSQTDNYVAYLFATCPGVSKVGSYTGTGTTQTINCGFTAGSRFVLIKRTDSTGSWYVWDSSRGIVAGNDPYLLLNSTAAEVTNTDYVDTASVGFEISSTAPAEINASGGSFIFLAIA
jgi:hypothetical protein